MQWHIIPENVRLLISPVCHPMHPCWFFMSFLHRENHLMRIPVLSYGYRNIKNLFASGKDEWLQRRALRTNISDLKNKKTKTKLKTLF